MFLYVLSTCILAGASSQKENKSINTSALKNITCYESWVVLEYFRGKGSHKAIYRLDVVY